MPGPDPDFAGCRVQFILSRSVMPMRRWVGTGSEAICCDVVR